MEAIKLSGFSRVLATLVMSQKHFFIFLTAIAILVILAYQFSLTRFTPFHPKPRSFYPTRHTNRTGNVPEIYFQTSAKIIKRFNRTCALFPDLFDIRIKNNNWQIQDTSSGTFYLFGAYLDNREGRAVRILGTYTRKRPQENFFCQFWYDQSEKPVLVQSETLFWLFYERWGADVGQFDHPYLITCPLGDSGVPMSVSLVEHWCDNATNNLRIHTNSVKTKKNFVVCVKGLSFPYEDKTLRLVEWIELLNILGVEKINFYEFNVHPSTKKVLDYYADRGRIEVTPLSLLGDVSNTPLFQSLYLKKEIIRRRLQEVIPYNDCLYKHINEFKYVVLLDIDEVIVPSRDTWVELLGILQKAQPNMVSYVALNVYFLDSHQHQHEWIEDVPKYMHMLQHVYRARNHTKIDYFVKGFHDTEKVVALHNHFPLACFNFCTHANINVTLAQLQHYRSDCVQEINCEAMRRDAVLDMRVWNYKEELVQRVEDTLQDLRVVPD